MGTMIERVLVPMNDSEMAERALRYALDVFQDADVTVLTVVGGPSPLLGEVASIAIADEPEQAAKEHAQPVLDRARSIAEEYDSSIETELRVGHPVRGILARAEAFDTVVIGSHGGSLTDRLYVGNVAETIVRRSPVPVIVVR